MIKRLADRFRQTKQLQIVAIVVAALTAIVIAALKFYSDWQIAMIAQSHTSPWPSTTPLSRTAPLSLRHGLNAPASPAISATGPSPEASVIAHASAVIIPPKPPRTPLQTSRPLCDGNILPSFPRLVLNPSFKFNACCDRWRCSKRLVLPNEVVNAKEQRDRVPYAFPGLCCSRGPCAGNASIPAERSERRARCGRREAF